MYICIYVYMYICIYDDYHFVVVRSLVYSSNAESYAGGDLVPWQV